MFRNHGIRTVVFIGAGVLSAGVFAQATAQTPAGEPPAKAGMTQKTKDKMFIKTAAEGGLMEVQLGQLAAQKGNSDDVKSFGQKMVDDHTALNEAMKPIAEKMGVVPPAKLNKKDQATYDMMNAKSGEEFDKAYIKDMVMDHHKDLREFTAEAKDAADADLKAAVEHGRDVIKEHTQMIDKIAKDKGLTMPMKKKTTAAPAAP